MGKVIGILMCTLIYNGRDYCLFGAKFDILLVYDALVHRCSYWKDFGYLSVGFLVCGFIMFISLLGLIEMKEFFKSFSEFNFVLTLDSFTGLI